jgi:hypothetical protein
MVMILTKDYDDWLSCPVAEAPSFFKQWMGAAGLVPCPIAAASAKNLQRQGNSSARTRGANYPKKGKSLGCTTQLKTPLLTLTS